MTQVYLLCMIPDISDYGFDILWEYYEKCYKKYVTRPVYNQR